MINVPYSNIFERPTIFGEAVVVRTSSRNSKEVFKNETKWYDGLTIRERIFIMIVYGVINLLFLLRGKSLHNYQMILQQIKTHQNSL